MAVDEGRLNEIPWDLRDFGPGPAEGVPTVLALAGALCTTAFFEELGTEAALADVRLVAATLPGQGGTEAPDDLSVESYARLGSHLAARLDADVVLGHSLGANVALEMAASGGFSGPLVLLAPSLSRRDESMFPRVLDRLCMVAGWLPCAAALKIMGPAMKGSLPSDRHGVLVAELRKNDPRVVRRHLREYLRYLDRHGSVASRLCESGASSWVVYGDRDDIGITDQERRILDGCPHATVVTIPDVGHFLANQQPGRVAEIVLEALAARS